MTLGGNVISGACCSNGLPKGWVGQLRRGRRFGSGLKKEAVGD